MQGEGAHVVSSRKSSFFRVWPNWYVENQIHVKIISISRKCDMQLSNYSHYTGCIKKKVIELWSALARSLYNLQKSFFYSRKDQTTHIFTSEHYYGSEQEKKIPLIIYLSRETINVANKMH